MPCIVNAANEVVNLAFRQDRIGFNDIARVIELTMQKATFTREATIEAYLATDAEARRIAEQLIQN